MTVSIVCNQHVFIINFQNLTIFVDKEQVSGSVGVCY